MNPRGPQPIADILSDLLARRGYARVQANEAQQAAWSQVVPLAWRQFTRVGGLKRGVLEVFVSNSAMIQELTYQKATLLQNLAIQLPQEKLKDLRFRVG